MVVRGLAGGLRPPDAPYLIKMFQSFDPMLRTNGGPRGAEPPWRGVWGAEPPSKPLHHHFLPKNYTSQLNQLGKP